MRFGSSCFVSLTAVLLFHVVVGCSQSAPTSPSKPAESAPKKPEAPKPAAPPPAKSDAPAVPSVDKSAPSAAKENQLALQGIVMTIPDGWVRETVTPGPMAAVAAFKLPQVEGDAEDVAVRVTHFREMKGKDDVNIDRWLGQVTRPDGTAATRQDAKITTKESGAIRLTIVDLAGTMNTSMGGAGTGKPNQRMIAAIVDHPQGPHYVKATGGVASMEKWESSIRAFLSSAKAN